MVRGLPEGCASSAHFRGRVLGAHALVASSLFHPVKLKRTTQGFVHIVVLRGETPCNGQHCIRAKSSGLLSLLVHLIYTVNLARRRKRRRRCSIFSRVLTRWASSFVCTACGLEQSVYRGHYLALPTRHARFWKSERQYAFRLLYDAYTVLLRIRRLKHHIIKCNKARTL